MPETVDVGLLAPGRYEVNLIGWFIVGIPMIVPRIGVDAREELWVLDPASGLRSLAFATSTSEDGEQLTADLTLSCGLPENPSLSLGYILQRERPEEGLISIAAFEVLTENVCTDGQETWTQQIGPVRLEVDRYRVSVVGYFFDDGAFYPVFDTVVDRPPVGEEIVAVQDGRFSVFATWTKATGETGSAHGRLMRDADDSASFYFFRPGNAELVVKVLDGCASNGYHWVFAGGLTNLGVSLSVVDNETGAAQRYDNPQGMPFAPVQDRFAFDCLVQPAG